MMQHTNFFSMYNVDILYIVLNGTASNLVGNWQYIHILIYMLVHLFAKLHACKVTNNRYAILTEKQNTTNEKTNLYYNNIFFILWNNSKMSSVIVMM